MIRLFLLFIVSLFYQALQGQIINGGFETSQSGAKAAYWAGKTYTLQVVLDSNGKSYTDSVVYDKSLYSITSSKVHSGSKALELRNAYNFTKSQSMPGVAFASNDTNGFVGFTNTYIPVTSNPDALKFYCVYLPKQADTALVQIKVFDASMNEIGTGLRKIETGVPDWEAITVPVEYSSVADAAYVQVSFASAMEGNSISLGTVLFVDDVELLNFTSMDADPMLNPINVFPNPSAGNVKMTIQKNVKVSDVFLVNMGGQVITVQPSSEGVYWTNNLDDGIYIVVAKGTNFFYRYKLVVKR
jgi:hypothetical protein